MTLPPALPSERHGHPAPPEIAEHRAALMAAIAAGSWKTARPPVEALLRGRSVLRCRPGGEPRARVLHFHGGGFRMGAPEMIGPFAEVLADRCGAEVVVPRYRLAPEHPFPAGLADAIACLQELAHEGSSGLPLIVSGDSAGAGLAASLAVLAATGGPRIDGLVLLSPWLDLTATAASYAGNAANDPMFSREAAVLAAGLYLQGFDPCHPLASALFAPIATYPPTFIGVGAGEVLLDDSLRFYEKLRAIGASSELNVIDGMDHVSVVRSLDLPGATETMMLIEGFINSIIADAGQTHGP